MERSAFEVQVRADRLDEYRERHRAVWPEMLAALSAAGWTQLLAVPAPGRPADRVPRDRGLRGRPAGDGGDRRERPLAGRDGAVLRAASSRSSGWKRCSTLTDVRRHRPRRLERARGLRALRRRDGRARGVPPLRRTAPCGCRTGCAGTCCTSSPRRSARCAAARSTASASTPGASTTRCSTRATACSACPSTTATSAPTGVERGVARLRGHRHPAHADQHRLPAAGRRPRRREARPRSRSCPTCSPTG